GFDFGNSPIEFSEQSVLGKSLVMTTTNGTRALRACAGAKAVLVGCLLNVSTVSAWIRRAIPTGGYTEVLLACSGTDDDAAIADTVGAGAVANKLWDLFDPTPTDHCDQCDGLTGRVSDSAAMARQVYLSFRSSPMSLTPFSKNARRLLSTQSLRADVAYCLVE